MVIMGIITAPHGVRGQMKVKIFCERAQDLTAYGSLSLEDGTALTLQIKGFNKGLAICSAASVSDRNAAEALKGRALFPSRGAPSTLRSAVQRCDMGSRRCYTLWPAA